MSRWFRALVALVAPLALSGCLFFPGQFESSLTIHADRSFTYSYKGEVLALDVQGLMAKAVKAGAAAGAKGEKIDKPGLPSLQLTPEEQAKQDEQFRKLATELARETGYRTVEYRGKGVFYIDYSISGVLSHSFVFPYNLDNHLIMPWVAIEVRGKDLVRVKAPGFARPDASGLGMGSSMSGMGAFPLPGADDPTGRMNGTFTLSTDAELVSQNNEDGYETVGSMRTVTWKVTSSTVDAPMASMRVKPAP
jgi:hypothetical protein